MRVHELLTRRCFALRFGAVCAVPVLGRGPFQFTAAGTRLSAAPTPPIAPIEAKTFEEFGRVRVDPYYWLRNRRDPRVIALLGAENAYADARLEQIKPLVDELAAELQARATRGCQRAYHVQWLFLSAPVCTRGSVPAVVRWKDIAESSEEELVLDVGLSRPVTGANLTLVRGPSAQTIGASPLPLISMVMANFACLYARFQRARWMIKASEALRQVLCSGPIAKAYSMFAMTQNSSCISGLATPGR